MNISVCTDDLTYLKNLMSDITLNFGHLFNNIDAFISGDAFIRTINSSCITYDFFILDIHTKDRTGIDVAKVIRGSSKYRNAVIFFISSIPEELQRIIDIHPYAYLIKDTSFQLLNQKLREAVDNYTYKNTNIIFNSGKNFLILNPCDIYYIKVQNGLALIQTTKELLNFTLSAKNLQTTLSKYNTTLVRINNSVFINLLYLLDKSSYTLTMNDDKHTVFSLTRAYTENFMIKFKKYRNFYISRY